MYFQKCFNFICIFAFLEYTAFANFFIVQVVEDFIIFLLNRFIISLPVGGHQLQHAKAGPYAYRDCGVRHGVPASRLQPAGRRQQRVPGEGVSHHQGPGVHQGGAGQGAGLHCASERQHRLLLRYESSGEDTVHS